MASKIEKTEKTKKTIEMKECTHCGGEFHPRGFPSHLKACKEKNNPTKKGKTMKKKTSDTKKSDNSISSTVVAFLVIMTILAAVYGLIVVAYSFSKDESATSVATVAPAEQVEESQPQPVVPSDFLQDEFKITTKEAPRLKGADPHLVLVDGEWVNIGILLMSTEPKKAYHGPAKPEKNQFVNWPNHGLKRLQVAFKVGEKSYRPRKGLDFVLTDPSGKEVEVIWVLYPMSKI
jgi:hypothetical protein